MLIELLAKHSILVPKISRARQGTLGELLKLGDLGIYRRLIDTVIIMEDS
jgi:hypothetical protein